MTSEEYQAMLDQMVRDAETGLREALGERGAVVFLAPMGAHHAIAVEAWQAVGQWDLQLGVDGALLAIRYGLAESEAEYLQTLYNLKSRVTAAASSDVFAGKRIVNVSGLNQYYRDMGAYDDITPDDGDDSTFTPAQPPPVPAARRSQTRRTALWSATARICWGCRTPWPGLPH